MGAKGIASRSRAVVGAKSRSVLDSTVVGRCDSLQQQGLQQLLLHPHHLAEQPLLARHLPQYPREREDGTRTDRQHEVFGEHAAEAGASADAVLFVMMMNSGTKL